MSAHHLHFEVLCALAPTGQLSPQELEELHDHLSLCASCAGRLMEFSCLGSEILLTSSKQLRRELSATSMRERFVARASRDGVPLHRPVFTSALSNTLRLATTGLALLLLVVVTLRSASIQSFFSQTSLTGLDKVCGQQRVQSSPEPAHPETVLFEATSPRMQTGQARHAPAPSQTRAHTQKMRFVSKNTSVPPRHLLPVFKPFRSVTPSYSILPVSQAAQSSSILTFPYSHSKAYAPPDFEVASILKRSDLSRPLTPVRQPNLEHPSFTFHAGISADTQQNFLTALDSNVNVLDIQTRWNANIPRVRLWQITTDEYTNKK
jgi:hypothetical protein